MRVVDKVPPQVAWLNKTHQETFSDIRVEFKSANLINAASCELCFEGKTFQYAINCACETKLGQTDPVYEEGVYKVGINCAQAAAKHGVQKYIEISTGQLWSDKVSHKEEDEVDPWTSIAKYKYKVEEELKTIPNLHYSIIRPGIVYGPGDKSALGARLVITGLYRDLGETMKLFWGEDLGMNTIHVRDLARAIWHLASEAPCGIYHATDDGATTQGDLMTAVGKVFGVIPDYLNSIALAVCSATDLSVICDEVNDKHAGPWAKACARDSIENTPLSPYVVPEHLLNRHIKLDSTKLKNTGFSYEHSRVTEKLFREIIDDYISMKMFPKSLVS